MATRTQFVYLVEGDGTGKDGGSPAVLAMKLLLHQVLHHRNRVTGHTRRPVSTLTGRWDKATTKDLVVAKQWLGLRDINGKVNPHVFGLNPWKVFWTYATGTLGGRVNALVQEEIDRRARAKLAAAIAAKQAAATPRVRLVAAADKFLDQAAYYVYAQIRPAPVRDLYSAANRRRFDCSSTVIALYYAAGVPVDPSGYGYAGWGDTGALWRHGTRTYAPLPGDFAFYGWETRNGRPQHVAMHLGGGEVVTFGSTPPRRRPVGYRSDYIGSRSYL